MVVVVNLVIRASNHSTRTQTLLIQLLFTRQKMKQCSDWNVIFFTGKSSVICAIVMAYFYNAQSKKLQNRGKILICATSNAAVDGLVIRLLNLRQSLPKSKFILCLLRFYVLKRIINTSLHSVPTSLSYCSPYCMVTIFYRQNSWQELRRRSSSNIDCLFLALSLYL